METSAQNNAQNNAQSNAKSNAQNNAQTNAQNNVQNNAENSAQIITVETSAQIVVWPAPASPLTLSNSFVKRPFRTAASAPFHPVSF